MLYKDQQTTYFEDKRMGCDFYIVKTLRAQVRNTNGDIEYIESELCREPMYFSGNDYDEFRTYQEQKEDYKKIYENPPVVLYEYSEWNSIVSPSKRNEYLERYSRDGELVSLEVFYFTEDRM